MITLQAVLVNLPPCYFFVYFFLEQVSDSVEDKVATGLSVQWCVTCI